VKLLIVVLNRTEKLEEILAAYVEVGIPGATILDTVGMGHVLGTEIPVFAGFRDFLEGTRQGNKTLVSVVEDDERIDEAIRVIEQICGPLDAKGAGIAFSLPIDRVHGFRPVEG
jgi:nitrogen regulatory protein PII